MVSLYRQWRRSSVWVASIPSGKLIDITGGADHSWSPVWSPDGRYLVLLSTRGGSIGLWIWNAQTGQLKRGTRRAYDYRGQSTAPAWLGNGLVAGVFLSPKVPTNRDQSVAGLTQNTLTSGWKRADSGKATASVIDVGASNDTKGPADDLVLVDASTRAERLVASGYSVTDVRPSPNRKLIAFLRKTSAYRPVAGASLPLVAAFGGYQLSVVDTAGTKIVPLLAAVRNIFPEYENLYSPIVWSAESRQITVQGTASDALTNEVQAYIVTLPTGSVSQVNKPCCAPGTPAPTSAPAVTVQQTRDGTTLLLRLPGKQSEPIARRNRFLANIQQGEVRKVAFAAADGTSLQAWLLLPVGYHDGRRCPLVTWVYPGQSAGSTIPYEMELYDDSMDNLNLLSAHGYCVLYPSIPVHPSPYGAGGEASGDPMLDLPKSVLPAIDKVVALGVADPKRLAVMGVSYGGWATYALIGQTTRFKAAIAIAGMSDLLSAYGEFDAASRFADVDFAERVQMMSYSEDWVERFGVPPWDALDRYLRNSPITLAGHVTTPIMIVQGDMDSVPIQQGEEYTTAMYRLGNRAEFVRYIGEGHVVESPANIRDLWDRIYGWLDRYDR